jgi:hypothetical protein
MMHAGLAACLCATTPALAEAPAADLPKPRAHKDLTPAEYKRPAELLDIKDSEETRYASSNWAP